MSETSATNAVFGIRRIWTALLVAVSLAIGVAGFGVTPAQAANTYDSGVSGESSLTAPQISVAGTSFSTGSGIYYTNGRSWR